jgi:hypothetical protein
VNPKVPLTALGLILLASPAIGAEGPIVRAERLLEGEQILVDGLADEEAWQRAEAVTDFVGYSPTEGFEPVGDTSVRLLTNETHLYVYFKARFDEPTRVRAYLSEREDVNRDDQVALYLDPFGDGRRAYVFWLNPLGVQQDMLTTLDGYWNSAWDAVFKTRGRIVDGGYDVEVAIPFRSLRFDPKSEQPWRILLKRKFTARDEYVSFPPVLGDEGPELLQYAELQGISPQRAGIGLELLPTVVVRTGQDRDEETDELTWRKPGFPDTVDPGIGVKWQLTPSLALGATVNPDFSQIEADPNRIDNNLRYALWLDERRPFFLEGRELYSGFLLYSRSIVDPIYGVKLSGKQGPVSIAVMHALDESPAASVQADGSTPGFTEDDVEGALSLVTHAETRFDIGERSNFEIAWSDKELLKAGVHHADSHALNLSTKVAIDPTSQVDVSVAYSATGRVGGERLHGPSWWTQYARNQRLFDYGISYWGSGEGFRNENGFDTRSGLMGVSVWGSRRFEFDGPFPWLRVGGNAWNAWGSWESGQPLPDGSRQVLWAQLRGPAQTTLFVQTSRWDLLYEGKNFDGGWLIASLSNSALEWLQISAGASGGNAVRYDDATRTIERSVWASAEVRGFRRLTVDLNTRVNWLGRDGEQLDRLWIYRTKWVLGITRALSVRVIVQGRHETTLDVDREVVGAESGLDLSALVTLIPSPGTSIHLGFGERWSWDPDVDIRTEQRDLFLKASLLIRL